MAKLLEYQGKELFRSFAVPVPRGKVVQSADEARDVAQEIGYPLVVKAQVYAGKRGKAGGVRIAADEDELMAVSREMLSSEIRGYPVQSLLVEEKLDVKSEMYLGVAADPTSRAPMIMACRTGGVDIEEVTELDPQALHTAPVDALRGVYVHDALNLLRDLPDLTSKQKLQVAQILQKLYTLYRACDCKLIEINPLALVPDGVVALDARVDIDGDALGRQKHLGIKAAEEAGDRSATLLEQIAAMIDEGDHRGTVHFVQIDPDLSYVQEQGLVPIGFDCVGAGVSLTMMDELVPLGYYPINFCDSSGNPVASKLYRITKVIFSQPGIRGYIFASCVSSQQLDNTARGIIKGLKELYPETHGQPNIPTVLAFRGAWDEDALRLLDEHGVSAGEWIQVLGREATEKDVAMAFHNLLHRWEAAHGGLQ